MTTTSKENKDGSTSHSCPSYRDKCSPSEVHFLVQDLHILQTIARLSICRLDILRMKCAIHLKVCIQPREACSATQGVAYPYFVLH
ncbi:hypothetical protein J6590_044850 [Homalodisca vitripennis]|nr:hypothetical protein J6590_044850 [Homalodisca vitripennis]